MQGFNLLNEGERIVSTSFRRTLVVAATVLATIDVSGAHAQAPADKVNAANAAIADYQKATNDHSQAMKALSAGITVAQKYYEITGKIDQATGTIAAMQQKAIDFKNADAITKVNMRCDSPLLGMQAAAKKLNMDLTKYYQTRQYVCQLAVYAAKLQQMYQDYQNIKTNGLPLVQKYKKEGHDFPGNHHRTSQSWVDVRYMPDPKSIQYGAWFQFSDNKKMQLIPFPVLNVNSDDAKRGICLPFASHARFCFKVLDATPENAKIDLWFKLRAYDRDKTISLGTVVIPAPFGYLDQLNQMKEDAKQKAVNDFKKHLADLANIDAQTQQKIQTLAGLAATINQ